MTDSEGKVLGFTCGSPLCIVHLYGRSVVLAKFKNAPIQGYVFDNNGGLRRIKLAMRGRSVLGIRVTEIEDPTLARDIGFSF